MSDLISRSELIKHFEAIQQQENAVGIDFVAMIDEIKEQPTAYDVDKVVEELEKLADDSNDYMYECYFNGKEDGIREAIEIVKQEAEKFGTDTNVGSKGNDVLEFANLLKELCCKKDEDYDDPVISPKYLNDTIENLLLDFNVEYNNGWIPCSERLPEESGYYLVTYHDWSDGNFLPKYDDTYVRRLHYQISEHFVGWNYPKNVDDRAENDCHKEVIAWQSLPEPFKERD